MVQLASQPMLQQKLNLMEQVELARLRANHRIAAQKRAELGQFMTPAAVARLMASMLVCDTPHVSLLDAGAGVGSLLSAVVEALTARQLPPKSLHISAYEIDSMLAVYLRETLEQCALACANVGVSCTYTVIEGDFIEDVVGQLTNPLFTQQPMEYTCAILNPPYRKIQTNSVARRLLSRVGIETSNLYTGFLSLAMQLLAPDGEIVAITPRSFCSGSYFRPFRENMLRLLSLRHFHIFNTRIDAFRDDDVLQETVIFSATRTAKQSPVVQITMSDGPDDDLFAVQYLPFEQLVHPHDPERFIHLVPDASGEQVAEQMSGLPACLSDLGLQVSTGRVVDFRAKAFLRAMPELHTVPLIYPTHVRQGAVQWPQPASKKPNALVQCEQTQDLLIPNEYYVLVKRFSVKEERRRVVAVVYDPNAFSHSAVGFENHLNYFHAHGRGLDSVLVCGLAAYLNSTLVDSYIRQFNGHTQINATDLRNLRYPSHEQLLAIGRRVGTHQLSQTELDAIVAQECGMTNSEEALDPVQIKRRIDEALDVLQALGLPRRQQNELSALTLLALLDLTPNTPWAEASRPLYGITPMMDFFARHYGKQYKPNTRETVRRQTVHQFLDAGIIVANPDDLERPINSPNVVYQIEQSVLELLRMYGTQEWQQHLQGYLASVTTLQRQYAQERTMRRIPVVLPSGEELRLSPGGQNVLIKEIIDHFAPRFTPGGEVLYVGDADEKFALFVRERLQELGAIVDEHGKMPDVVLYHASKNWLVLVEAVTSHGPIDPKRRRELAALFRSSSAGVVYVTAFLSRVALKEYLADISWETEVWVAEAPDHLIHFDGERFLGPYTV